MIERKKRLRFIQLILLISAIIITYLVYYDKGIDSNNEIISKSKKEKVKKQITEDEKNNSDIFFDIEYTGLDLNGNRYRLKSKEAQLDELKPEIVYMKIVEATFYFKDNTTLYVWADNGIYNNKTLDMKFKNNVKANYLDSELFAEKATYSNTNNYLSISENVRIDDIQGNLIADKLLFDITKQQLDITSFNDGKINANVQLNEKRF
tara:strand:+ start:927 stop:1547 length:621 start_codon:yes stop_codon:yes gene_type:complete